MKREHRPSRVLFVDDDSDSPRAKLAELFEGTSATVEILHPEDVLDDDLAAADVIIVDYFLSDWEARDDVESASRAPRDGLAVVANLRSRLLPKFRERLSSRFPERSVAFGLWSSNLAEATFGLPAYVLPQVFSRENNLEWAFNRTDVLTQVGVHQILELADATATLAAIWNSSIARQPADQLRDSLALLESRWAGDAWNDVLNCRPPVNELGERTNGMAVARWLLHRVLPYPTFLMNECELRIRLRALSLETEDSELSAAIRPLEYGGVLASFSGKRWWRAAVEDWLYEVTNGDSSNPQALETLSATLGYEFASEWRRPVAVVDRELRRSDSVYELDDVLRVRPDDWPVYAEPAYALLEEISADAELRSITDPLDAGRLGAA